MFVVSVDFTVAEGQLAAFLPLIRANAKASRETEPGCQRFDVCTAADKPDRVFLYEVYDDAAAFEAHKATAHFATFERAAGAMIAGKDVALWDISND